MTAAPYTTTVPRYRALAADLARGAMLALIALAHAQALTGRVLAPLPEETASTLDTVTQALLTLFVDSRAYPMFAALFGYGLVQIMRRREPVLGPDGARKVIRRRGAWLILFGADGTGVSCSATVRKTCKNVHRASALPR